MTAIKAGLFSPRLKGELEWAEREIAKLDEQIAAAEKPAVVSLHPQAVERYREELVKLKTSLEARDRPETAAILRSLVAEIKLTPLSQKRTGDVRVDLVGCLEGLMAGDVPLAKSFVVPGSACGTGTSERMVLMVAGTCSHLYRTNFELMGKAFRL